MSGRRFGIGLVTVVAALGMAFVVFALTLYIAVGMCDYNYSDVEQGSTMDDFCSSDTVAVFYVGYMAVPVLMVVVAGILGIKDQRWGRLWLGIALGIATVVAGTIVVAALPNTA